MMGSECEAGSSSKHRKKNKPLMEKKRRARINKCLSQLKQILIQDQHKNSQSHAKWEKADILEMTVEYLKTLRQQKSTDTSPATTVPSPTVPPTVPLQYSNFMQQYLIYQQQLAAFSSYMNFNLASTNHGNFSK
ncbi:unnamed protein product [Caenorhabditis angaria]|uniref:BHLH domain-containing protein n=1 Tax=Caenorhabditis angaria TaxID=860376 RepID=A0A9P1IRE7_9PELO|nr:unnamed protein product [Caenorhabditis angaria]